MVDKSDENLETFYIRNHSHLLSEPFAHHSSFFLGYLYSVVAAPSFGIFLPIQYPQNAYLNYINKYNLTQNALEILKNFQHELWTDLFHAPKQEIGTQSYANYLIVPLENTDIDWINIKRALKLEPCLKISNFLKSSRKNLILQYKSSATWRYISEVNKNSTAKEFLKGLLGEDFGNLASLAKKYEGFDPIDIALDDQFTNQSLAGFRNFVRSGQVKSLNENSVLIFAKQTKSVKHQVSERPKGKSFPKGTPILIESLTKVFYLSADAWDQGRSLLGSLIEIESMSFCVEFSLTFNYFGNMDMLKEACTSPGLDTKCNYESLETLGDTVLKTIYTLHIYLNEPSLNEHRLSRKRGWKVSNKHLHLVAIKNDLSRFLKTRTLKINNFRPPFYLSKDLPNETYEVEQKISENMLADFVEALIAAFYLSCGIKAAAEFMLKLEIISSHGWPYTSSFLSNEALSVLQFEDLLNFPDQKFKISELLHVPQKDSVSNIFNYEFFDKSLLEKALTHYTLNPEFNYERLEFLGDAVIDIVVLTNIWTLHKFDPEFLTYLKHDLVSNNTLAKISFVTGLYKFMNIDSDVKISIQDFCDKYNWDKDLFIEEEIGIDMPKCLGDIFESIVACILIDSNSLALTCTIFGFIFCNLILYMVKNINRYTKRPITRLCEWISENGKKIEFKKFIIDETLFSVEVFIENQFVLEEFGPTIGTTKDKASIKIFEMIERGEIKL